jgi:glutamine amidotransferase
MKVVIIKYNAGNIYSVQLALERLGAASIISDNPDEIRSADKIIFPGVGEASSAMKYLQENGLAEMLPQIKQPFLGICLGLQLMCRFSEENNTDCLNIFPVEVLKFPPQDKVPHMGWNSITSLKGKLFNNVPDGSFVYFVHSFFAQRNEFESAVTDYILPVSAAVEKDNFYAVQFHPEKSAQAGEQILRNFLEL